MNFVRQHNVNCINTIFSSLVLLFTLFLTSTSSYAKNIFSPKCEIDTITNPPFLPDGSFGEIIDCEPSYEVYDKMVKIKWEAQPNANFYHIYYINDEGFLIKLSTLSKSNTFCIDRSIKAGEKRTYIMYASKKNFKFSSKRQATPEEKNRGKVGARKCYTLQTPQPSAELNISEGVVQLSWPKVKGATYYKVQIFIAKRPIDTVINEALTIYNMQTLKPQSYRSFQNNFKFHFEPTINEIYFYRVQALNAHSKSEFSQKLPFSSESDYIRNKRISLNNDTKQSTSTITSTCNVEKKISYNIKRQNHEVKYINYRIPFFKDSSKVIHQISNQNKDFVSDGFSPQIWSVIIGIENYESLPKLKYSIEDAERMHDFITMCEPKNTNIEEVSSYIILDEKATKNEILSKLTDVTYKASSEDYILFYFSGHGRENAIIPVNSDGDDQAILFDELRNVVNFSEAKRKLIVLDACNNLTLNKTRKGQLLKYQNTSDSSSTILITSSNLNQNSLEDGRLKAGVFSYFLLNGLKGKADDNSDNDITLNELFQYVYNKVSTYTQGSQTPTISCKAINDFSLQLCQFPHIENP